MFLAVATLVVCLLVLASIHDLKTREIPDWISVVIGGVAVLGSATGWLDLDLVWVIAGGIVGLVAGYLLFRFMRLGGGDAKLIIALGMVVGPIGIFILLVGMAIAGGVLSLIAMLRGQRDYAYVPAIVAGFLGYVGFVRFVV